MSKAIEFGRDGDYNLSSQGAAREYFFMPPRNDRTTEETMTNAVEADFVGLLLKEGLSASDVLEARKLGAGSKEARQAFKEFAAGLEARASDARERTALAVCYWAQGLCEKALETARQEKSNEAGQFVAGLCLLALGRPTEAKDVLKALAPKAKSSTVHAALAEAHRKCGEKQAVHGVIKEALDRLGPCASLWTEAGIAADIDGDCERAVECYKKALECDGEHVDALFRLAYVADLNGDNDAALDLYRKCVQVKPVHSRALMNLGLLYEELGREYDALKCFQLVKDRHPVNQRARLYVRDAEASKDMYFDEEQQKRRERRNKVLETPISDFELSVRSRNCLEKMNVTTIGDLTRITETELLAFKNFGETSLFEIKQMMTSKGLRLGQALESDENKTLLKARSMRKRTVDVSKIVTRPVDDLGLSVRSQHCMQLLGIKTIGDLVAKTERELMECRNFGATSLTEVKKKLATYGLTLAEK